MSSVFVQYKPGDVQDCEIHEFGKQHHVNCSKEAYEWPKSHDDEP